MDPETVAALKALTDPLRLRILGRLAAGAATTEELIAELGRPLPSVVRHLALLRRAGLVEPGWVLRLDRLQALGRELEAFQRSHDAADPALSGPDGTAVGQDEARVLRGFVEDGRLTSIPAQQKKRLVVLHWLRDQVFTEGREYPEKEVNQRLALFHPDVAALRRYMVDERLVSREQGMYRRVG